MLLVGPELATWFSMGIRPAVVAIVVGGVVATGCGGDQVTSADRAVLEAVVEDHSIGYIEGSVGILQVIDGPTGEVGVRGAALPNEVVGPGVWAGHFESLQLSPGEYVVRIWMLACDASGCGDDLDEHVELARGRSNPDYSCETSLTLDAGEVSSLVAAIGPQGCIHIGDEPPPRNDRGLTGTVVDEPDPAAVAPGSPRTGALAATELVSTSDVDIEGQPVPPDTRQLEGE